MSTVKLFISYKSEYRDIALQVRDQLQAWGFETWLDKDEIPKGGYFRDAIQRGLETSDAVLGILTAEAFTSREVLWEWDYGIAKTRFIPLRWQAVPLPYHLQGSQYIDFVSSVEQGFRDLQATLGTQSVSTQTTHVVPRATVPTQATPSHDLPQTRQQPSNRTMLLDQVHLAWIEGVLHANLEESRQLDMGIRLAPNAVLRYRDLGDYPLNQARDILQVFEDNHRQLLILGAPGGGKTILMLQLAERLIAQARADAGKPIPLIFNLSSWASTQRLQDWLVVELRTKYGVPKQVANDNLQHDQLLFLLDGLDEVQEEHRSACVEAINAFRKTHPYTDMVVCSRLADYTALTQQLDLTGAIALDKLTPSQIDDYLAGAEFAGVRQAMQPDGELHQLAETPFLLNAIATAYRGCSPYQLQLASKERRTTHLFARYVETRLRSTSSTYVPHEQLRFMAWLARRMVEHGKTTFYIEELQPSWLQSGINKWFYRGAIGVIFGLIGVLIGGLIGVLIVGLVGVLIVGLLGGLTVYEIRLSEKLVWSLSWKSLRAMIVRLVIGLIVGLIGGLIWGIRVGLIWGLIVGLIGGLSGGLIGGLSGGLRHAESVELRNIPNSGIKRSLQNGLRVMMVWGLIWGMIGGIIGGTIWGLTVGLRVGLSVGLIGGLFVGLNYGLRAVIQHVVLRFLLQREGALPGARGALGFIRLGNYANFLDQCTRLGLLRKVGGGYIFRHRYLLEYFAEQELK